MENVDEFERWLDKLLKDAKDRLSMTDETIAYFLLREGTAYYLRTICHECLPERTKSKS